MDEWRQEARDRQSRSLPLPTARRKRPPRPCSATKSESRTLPNQLLHVSPEFLGHSVAFALHRFFLKCVMLHGLLAPGSFLVSYASSAMVCVRPKDFTLWKRNKGVEWKIPTLQLFRFVLETRYCFTTERPSFPRLDHPDFFAKTSVWNRSVGCHRCLRLRPQSPPPKY